MTEIRKRSWAADALMNAKEKDTIFIPLDYNYGKNFDGPRVETRKPEMNQPIRKTSRKGDKID